MDSESLTYSTPTPPPAAARPLLLVEGGLGRQAGRQAGRKAATKAYIAYANKLDRQRRLLLRCGMRWGESGERGNYVEQ